MKKNIIIGIALVMIVMTMLTGCDAVNDNCTITTYANVGTDGTRVVSTTELVNGDVVDKSVEYVDVE